MHEPGCLDVGANADSLARQTLAVVLAGGQGTRLGALTAHECKPALPFGGAHRTIDFSLANCLNSGVVRVGVATQYLPQTLHAHLRTRWEEPGRDRGGFVTAWPADLRRVEGGYRGTADAVYRNWGWIEAGVPRHVLILAGDHVYQMDYRRMLAEHARSRADVTVGCVEVPAAEAGQFGVLVPDALGRVQQFVEKPGHPERFAGATGRVLASMGVYVFEANLLGWILREDARDPASAHDFGGDLLPRLVGSHSVHAFRFGSDAPVGRGYWRDVGTVAAYWDAHMDLLAPEPRLILDDATWPIGEPTHPRARHVDRLSGRSAVEGSLLAVKSQVGRRAGAYRSVLSDESVVEADAWIHESLLLPGAVVGRGCRLSRVVVPSGCHVPAGTVVGDPEDLTALPRVWSRPDERSNRPHAGAPHPRAGVRTWFPRLAALDTASP